ncbi:MAG: TRAP transporter substrate-binding protein DctP [Deltaproteobacteria bacterium]|nr:TRAP transporter substrate-binding protein DctP [Deltaproteobacteria bacterium]
MRKFLRMSVGVVGVLFLTILTILYTSLALAETEITKWRMVTNWTPSINLIKSDANFCKLVNELSGGKLQITLYPAGTLVPSAGVFNAVRKGKVECGGDWSSYWAGMNSAFEFGASFPMGMTQHDYINWYYFGGGKDMYNYLFGKFNMVYFGNMCLPSESGIRSNVPIKSLADFKGKKLRMAGKCAGYILQKLGAAQMMTAGGEIYQALQLKTMDGAEFGSPSVDWGVGFGEITKYNIAPGWHQPASFLGCMINKKAWNSLTPELQRVVELAAQANMAYMTSYFDNLNIATLRKFKESGTTVYKLNEEELRQIEKYAFEWVEQECKKNPDYLKVARSYFQYMKDYTEVRDYCVPFGHGRNPASFPNIGLE